MMTLAAMTERRIPAIPTKYKGVQFRSRLEAKWATFFDLAGWGWSYEPVDLDGYIPDFILDLHRPLLVEVKPALYLGELAETTGKIASSGWQGEALLVGASLHYTNDANPIVGLLGERCMGPDGGMGWDWGHGRLFTCAECESASVLHVDRSWSCRVCGHAGGNGHIGPMAARKLWVKAGNVTQWRPKV